jgi:hypothetical protein
VSGSRATGTRCRGEEGAGGIRDSAEERHGGESQVATVEVKVKVRRGESMMSRNVDGQNSDELVTFQNERL